MFFWVGTALVFSGVGQGSVENFTGRGRTGETFSSGPGHGVLCIPALLAS